MTATYVIQGSEVSGLEDFWRAVGEAVNGPGGYFGTNLDAFADCLSGGYGRPPGNSGWSRPTAAGTGGAPGPGPNGHIHYHSPPIATKHANGEIPP
ncbi:barstar family protein [Nocardiopsis aegyptia]|uniref:barstar family protein n=1 Tax=Nocardiopsis aegyptia TaxID=220378 RepID=UPI00366C4382